VGVANSVAMTTTSPQVWDGVVMAPSHLGPDWYEYIFS